MITINHFDNNETKNVKGFIIREEDDFICKVFWPTDFITDIRKEKLESAIKIYIETKSEIREYDYLVCWRKVRFNLTKEFFERYETLILRANIMQDKFVKKVQTC